MRIHLVRHGETPGNASRVVQTPETPLSERGREQARRVAARFAGTAIRQILSSDYRRAAMTAESIREATGVGLNFVPDLQERDFGDLRGRPYAGIDVDIFAADYAPPAGETWETFHARVDRAWRAVRDAASQLDGGGDLIVVTHGLVLHSLVTRRLTVPQIIPIEEMGFANTSVTITAAAPPWTVEVLACVRHLEEPPSSTGKVV